MNPPETLCAVCGLPVSLRIRLPDGEAVAGWHTVGLRAVVARAIALYVPAIHTPRLSAWRGRL